MNRSMSGARGIPHVPLIDRGRSEGWQDWLCKAYSTYYCAVVALSPRRLPACGVVEPLKEPGLTTIAAGTCDNARGVPKVTQWIERGNLHAIRPWTAAASAPLACTPLCWPPSYDRGVPAASRHPLVSVYGPAWR